MNQSENMNRLRNQAGQRHSSDSGTIVLFIIAALMVLFALLHWAAHDTDRAPMYDATIRKISDAGIVVKSKGGEKLLPFEPEKLRVEDINGQVIDCQELHTDDRIKVAVKKDGEKTLVDRIILLPNDISVYI